MKGQFENYLPRWVTKLPKVEPRWNALVQTLEGHSSYVNTVAFSDGLLASASDDLTIKLWDPISGALLETLQGHSREVSAMFFLDGLFVSVSQDCTAKLWDPGSGRMLNSINMNLDPDSDIDGYYHLDFSANLLVSASRTGRIEVWAWDRNSRKFSHTPQRRFSIKKRIHKFILSSAGIIAVSCSHIVVLWNARSGLLLRTLKLEPNSDLNRRSVTRLAFSPDGQFLAMARQTITLSNTESGQILRTFKHHTAGVEDMAFSTDGKLLASASSDCTIKLWDLNSGAELASLYDVSIDKVWDIAFSNNGKMLASANGNGNVQLWDLDLRAQQTQGLEAHSEEITTAEFSPDGKIFCSASLDGSIKIWSTRSGVVLRSLGAHSNEVTRLAISPDGKFVASGAQDKTVKIWDLRSGSLLRTLISHSSPITALTFSPDGELLAAASSKVGGYISLWNASSGKLQQTLLSHLKEIIGMTFSPDGRTLASRALNSVKMWKTSSGALSWTRDDHYPTRTLFTPNGKLVAIQNYDKIVTLLDAALGELVREIELPDEDCRVSFSEDGSLLLASGEPLYVVASNQTTSLLPKPVPAINVKHDWVYRGTEKILWLPPEYRPRSKLYSVHGNMLALCLRSRRVVFIELAFDELYQGIEL